jgi:hypothetical protein
MEVMDGFGTRFTLGGRSDNKPFRMNYFTLTASTSALCCITSALCVNPQAPPICARQPVVLQSILLQKDILVRLLFATIGAWQLRGGKKK